MILSFHPCITADHQIILGHRQPDSDDASFISRADLIILPQTCSEKLYVMCAESGAAIFPDYHARFNYPGKVGQSILFNREGLPQPETLRWNSIDHFRAAVDNALPHKYPFLLKEDRTHEAGGIHLIREQDDIEISLMKIMKRKKKEVPFVSQEYIHAGGNALRVVIMENSYISYWKKSGAPGQEVSTISNGAVVDKKWRPELQKKGIDMAGGLTKKTGVNLAAVDFIFNLNEQDPEPLFLEINYYFGRRGLGGTINYYDLLFRTVSIWMDKNGYDSKKIGFV